MIYVTLDDRYFVEGWSTTEMDGFIQVKKEKMIDKIKDAHGLYRYEQDIDEFIRDDTKALEESKKTKLFSMNNESAQKNSHGFKVSINGENLRFQNTNENKTFLQKAYAMFESGLINSTTMKFINSYGDEITRVIEGSNIYEIWILSFLHEDELNKHFNEVILPSIEEAKTFEELDSITWEGSQV